MSKEGGTGGRNTGYNDFSIVCKTLYQFSKLQNLFTLANGAKLVALGGQQSTMDRDLASHPAAPGSFLAFQNFSKKFDVAGIYRQLSA